MTDSSRRIAYHILKSVDGEGAYSNLLLNQRLRTAKDADPALTRRLVHGVLNYQLLLDYQIARFLRKKGLKRSAKILLRLGFYQLALCDDIPDHAAVDQTVSLAGEVAKGTEGFVNAVLRSFVRQGKVLHYPQAEDGEESLTETFSVRYSCPPWIVRIWLNAYGRQRTEEILRASLQAPPLSLRPNPLKCREEEDFDLSAGIADSPDYKAGRFSVQDASAREAVRVLAPKPEERVLDLCAAPGGKTCAMAELMQNKGSILACDIHAEKLPLIERGAKRLGLSIIGTRQRDAAAALSPQEENAYDAVMCDVPCSGLGVLRRKPEIKWRLREEELAALVPLQAKILRNAGRAARPGGRILYATCTINPAENEGVTGAFLAEGGFETVLERQIFTGEDAGGTPGDGFYYCLIRKKDL